MNLLRETCQCCERPAVKVWHCQDGSANPLCDHHWPKGRQGQHYADPWPPGATAQVKPAYRRPVGKKS